MKFDEAESMIEEQWESNTKATLDLLPEKSKERYEVELSCLEVWMREKNLNDICETVLLTYFEDMSKKYLSSSLWSKYSMLKRTLLVKKNIDISSYRELIKFLKEKEVGHVPKKAMVLSKENITKFITEAPDDVYLMTKVALIFGIYGGCRRDELANMSINDIEDRGSVIVVTIPRTKTSEKRVFAIVDTDSFSAIAIYKKYVALREAKDVQHSRFFVGYRNSQCTKQCVGKNTFGAVPKVIAKYLNLPNADRYTGHTFRRTSATLFTDSGADITFERHGPWNSIPVLERYVDDSI